MSFPPISGNFLEFYSVGVGLGLIRPNIFYRISVFLVRHERTTMWHSARACCHLHVFATIFHVLWLFRPLVNSLPPIPRSFQELFLQQRRLFLFSGLARKGCPCCIPICRRAVWQAWAVALMAGGKYHYAFQTGWSALFFFFVTRNKIAPEPKTYSMILCMRAGRGGGHFRRVAWSVDSWDPFYPVARLPLSNSLIGWFRNRCPVEYFDRTRRVDWPLHFFFFICFIYVSIYLFIYLICSLFFIITWYFFCYLSVYSYIYSMHSTFRQFIRSITYFMLRTLEIRWKKLNSSLTSPGWYARLFCRKVYLDWRSE